MRKTDKFFNDFFEKMKEELSFITLKKNAKINMGKYEFVTDKELPVPVMIDNLVKDIQNQDEYDGIGVKNIVDGILFALGTDAEFEFKTDYMKLLNNLNVQIEPYVIYLINQLGETRLEESVVFGRCLTNTNENERTTFVYASALEKKAVDLMNKDVLDIANIFMDEAFAHYEKSLNYDDEFPLAYYKLGYYYKNNKQYVRAKLYWEKQQQFDTDIVRIDEIKKEIAALEIFVRFEIGYTHVLNSEPEKGLDILLPMVEEYSEWWNLLFFVGLAYRSLGEYKIAERYFENVLTLDNTQEQALNELGLCKLCLEKYDEAKEVFNALLQLNPANPEVLCNRAVAHYYLGESKKAQNDVAAALKLNPSDEVALEIQKLVN